MSLLIHRQTLEEWMRVPDENQVSRAHHAAYDQVALVAKGSQRAALIFGTSGVEMNAALENFKSILGQRRLRAHLASPSTQKDLISAFERAQNGALFIDDRGRLLKANGAISVLLDAMDPGRGKITLPKPKKTIHLRNPLVIWSEASLDRGVLPDEIDRLVELQPPIPIPKNERFCWEYAMYRAISTDVLVTLRPDAEDAEVVAAAFAMSLMTKRLDRVRKVSLATLGKFAGFRLGNPCCSIEEAHLHPSIQSLFHEYSTQGVSAPQADWASLIREYRSDFPGRGSDQAVTAEHTLVAN